MDCAAAGSIRALVVVPAYKAGSQKLLAALQDDGVVMTRQHKFEMGIGPLQCEEYAVFLGSRGCLSCEGRSLFQRCDDMLGSDFRAIGKSNPGLNACRING